MSNLKKFNGEFILNRDDWTGGKIKIKVKNDSFKIFDYTLKIVEKEEEGDKFFIVESSEHSETLALGFTMGKNFIFKDNFSEMTREDKNPFIALAKLACNIL